MTTVLRLIVALLLSMAILQLGGGLFGTLLGYRASLEGFSREAIGLLMSCYYLGFLVGTQVGARLIESVGHIRTFAACAALAAVVALLHAIAVDPYVWAVLRVITGVALAGLFMVIESWLNEQASNRIRGRVFSIYMVVNLLSMACGQLLLQAAAPASFVLFSLAAMLFALSLIPVSVSTIEAPALPPKMARLSFTRLYHASPLGVVGCFGVGLVNSAVWGLGPAFAYDLGFRADYVSYFMATIMLGGVALQWPLGYLSDRIDRRIVIIGVLAVATVASFLIPILGDSKAALFGLAALFGGMMLSVYSLCVSHTNDWLEREETVRASSALLLAFGVGAIFGPVIAGAAIGALGPAMLFVYTGAANLALVLFAAWRTLRRAAPPQEDKVAFVPIARTTPVVLSLDPRGDEAAEPGQANL